MDPAGRYQLTFAADDAIVATGWWNLRATAEKKFRDWVADHGRDGALRAALPRDLDPWVLAGVAVLGATLTLALTGHSGAALIVGASSLWLLVLQRAIDG
jgi:hypothetical protein